jgi:uncharacterized protein YyaL (SSP411 family)
MPNRLAGEASPYLLQHAHNPVDWYPWAPEALERARRENKPILLSIGYSACHWCHVMERESFENDDIARVMNEWFVNVKVDREERPDLDQIYQLVVQLMGRSGGWPLTVFLTPDQKPFFGGTYFPPTDRYGMPGFPKILQAVWEAYQTRREEVDAQSEELTRAIAETAAGEPRTPSPLGPESLRYAREKLASRFDDRNGGFGHRPKFPNTMALDVLLRAGDASRVSRALAAMRAGGVFDQLGGGFHRYSTDERWLVPHFEKMLYDNALLLRLCVDAWRQLGEERHATTARSIASYVMREMQSPEGGFYSTQDADSEGIEGTFFVWTPQQVDAACGGDEEAARIARRVWGVTDRGNFEETGATVLSVVEPPRDDSERAALERARRAMWEAREKRPKPFRDEKILASWNGLMIGSMADAGSALGDGEILAAAERAMAFVERVLVTREDGGRARVLRSAKDGKARGSGFLDDHAYLADASLDLYEATGSPHWVALARALAEATLAHFFDPASDSFFFVPDDGEKVLVRAKDIYDHAVPSSVSVACRMLLRLGALADPKYAEPATRVVEKLAPAAAANPMGLSSVVCLVDRLVRGSVDVVLVGPRASAGTGALARSVFRAGVRDRVVAWLDAADPASAEACRVQAEGKAGHGEPVAYVCRGRTCSLPIGDPAELAEALVTPADAQGQA